MPWENWRQRAYDEVFEQICRQVRQRRRDDPEFTLDHLRRLLHTEYCKQGDDWVGRGAMAHITQSATIAAYESILAEWEEEPLEP